MTTPAPASLVISTFFHPPPLSAAVSKMMETFCKSPSPEHSQIEESRKASAKMNAILGDPDRLRALVFDFVHHYERRVEEGSTLRGKVMFVCNRRRISKSIKTRERIDAALVHG